LSQATSSRRKIRQRAVFDLDAPVRKINLYDFMIFHHYLRKRSRRRIRHVELLLLRGWRATLVEFRLLLRATLLAWLGTAFVAAMDEWHKATFRRAPAPGKTLCSTLSQA